MTWETWSIYVLMVGAIALTPGPSTLLAASRAAGQGVRGCLPTIAGDLSANCLQMIVAVSGIGLVLATAPTFACTLKGAGSAYLAWKGIRLWRHQARDPKHLRSPRWVGFRRGFAEGFLVSAANPAAILFFFFALPPFLDAHQSIAAQIVALGGTFIAVDGASLLIYATAVRRLQEKMKRSAMSRLAHRLPAVLLMAAALLLARIAVR